MIDKPFTIGCDEVGYGCLAGPLVVAGVRAPKDWALEGLNDSKKLTANKRKVMRQKILKLVDEKVITYYLAERESIYIDKVGVAKALKEAYVECFKALYEKESLIISDGILKFDGMGVDDYDKISVVKADAKFPTVMAASILAKTFRDGVMKTVHNTYPMYNWDHNVGYGSKDHLKAIEVYGPCPLHRMSYAPMKNMKVKPLPGKDPRQTAFKDFG
jgi:ribonuclease HII